MVNIADCNWPRFLRHNLQENSLSTHFCNDCRIKKKLIKVNTTQFANSIRKKNGRGTGANPSNHWRTPGGICALWLGAAAFPLLFIIKDLKCKWKIKSTFIFLKSFHRSTFQGPFTSHHTKIIKWINASNSDFGSSKSPEN